MRGAEDAGASRKPRCVGADGMTGRCVAVRCEAARGGAGRGAELSCGELRSVEERCGATWMPEHPVSPQPGACGMIRPLRCDAVRGVAARSDAARCDARRCDAGRCAELRSDAKPSDRKPLCHYCARIER
jgi:hypothetical protein